MSRQDANRRFEAGGPDDIERILRELRDPHGPQVIPIGRLPGEALGHWPDRATDDVVITRERRNHYLERHLDMLVLQARVVRTLPDPADVHSYRQGRQMTISHVPLNTRRLIRAPVLMTTRPERNGRQSGDQRPSSSRGISRDGTGYGLRKAEKEVRWTNSTIRVAIDHHQGDMP